MTSQEPPKIVQILMCQFVYSIVVWDMILGHKEVGIQTSCVRNQYFLAKKGCTNHIPLGLIHIKSAKSGLFMLSVSENSDNQKDLF